MVSAAARAASHADDLDDKRAEEEGLVAFGLLPCPAWAAAVAAWREEHERLRLQVIIGEISYESCRGRVTWLYSPFSYSQGLSSSTMVLDGSLEKDNSPGFTDKLNLVPGPPYSAPYQQCKT